MQDTIDTRYDHSSATTEDAVLFIGEKDYHPMDSRGLPTKARLQSDMDINIVLSRSGWFSYRIVCHPIPSG